jgi:hypothetical protein
MHSSWIRSFTFVAGSAWWRFDGTLWGPKDDRYIGQPLLLATDEEGC